MACSGLVGLQHLLRLGCLEAYMFLCGYGPESMQHRSNIGIEWVERMFFFVAEWVTVKCKAWSAER